MVNPSLALCSVWDPHPHRHHHRLPHTHPHRLPLHPPPRVPGAVSRQRDSLPPVGLLLAHPCRQPATVEQLYHRGTAVPPHDSQLDSTGRAHASVYLAVGLPIAGSQRRVRAVIIRLVLLGGL
eukprot:223552-Rhodomonas_salina.1